MRSGNLQHKMPVYKSYETLSQAYRDKYNGFNLPSPYYLLIGHVLTLKKCISIRDWYQMQAFIVASADGLLCTVSNLIIALVFSALKTNGRTFWLDNFYYDQFLVVMSGFCPVTDRYICLWHIILKQVTAILKWDKLFDCSIRVFAAISINCDCGI